jgi:hypothetical protein
MDVVLTILFVLLAVVIMFGIAGMAQMLYGQKPVKNAGDV